MSRIAPFAAACSLIFLAACDMSGPRFTIDMRVTDEGRIRRTVIGNEFKDRRSRSDIAFGNNLMAIYGEPDEWRGGRPIYSGEFDWQLPTDLTCNGHTSHGVIWISRSQMGTTTIYIERMPGINSTGRAFRKLDEATTLLMEACYAYAAQVPALSQDPVRLEAVRTFLLNDLHDDLVDIALLSRNPARAQDEHNAESESKRLQARQLRVIQFLIERGYLRECDIREEDAEDDSLAELFGIGRYIGAGVHFERLVLRRVAGILGFAEDHPLPEELGRLSDPKHLMDAFRQGLDLLEPEKQARFESLYKDVLAGVMFAARGQVTLDCPVEPANTNGRWTADTRQIVWDVREASVFHDPDIAWASWSAPDEAFQIQHFGAVIVTADRLATYNKSIAELDAADRAAWESLLDAVRPADDIRAALKEFRFPSDSNAPNPTAPAAMLLEWLDSKPAMDD